MAGDPPTEKGEFVPILMSLAGVWQARTLPHTASFHRTRRISTALAGAHTVFALCKTFPVSAPFD
jgi:hypothetical protein